MPEYIKPENSHSVRNTLITTVAGIIIFGAIAGVVKTMENSGKEKEQDRVSEHIDDALMQHCYTLGVGDCNPCLELEDLKHAIESGLSVSEYHSRR